MDVGFINCDNVKCRTMRTCDENIARLVWLMRNWAPTAEGRGIVPRGHDRPFYFHRTACQDVVLWQRQNVGRRKRILTSHQLRVWGVGWRLGRSPAPSRRAFERCVFTRTRTLNYREEVIRVQRMKKTIYRFNLLWIHLPNTPNWRWSGEDARPQPIITAPRHSDDTHCVCPSPIVKSDVRGYGGEWRLVRDINFGVRDAGGDDIRRTRRGSGVCHGDDFTIFGILAISFFWDERGKGRKNMVRFRRSCF